MPSIASGTWMRGLPPPAWRLRPNSAILRASMRRSISTRSRVAKSSAIATGLIVRPSEPARSSGRAKSLSSRRSRSTRPRSPGRRTLTATLRPSWSRARCTWAIDAAARGRSSKEAKSRPIGAPSPSSTTRRTVDGRSGGTSSRSWRNSSQSAAGKMPGLEATSWPSFTKVGPSSTKLFRSARARATIPWSRGRSTRKGPRRAVLSTPLRVRVSPILPSRTASSGESRRRSMATSSELVAPPPSLMAVSGRADLG